MKIAVVFALMACTVAYCDDSKWHGDWNEASVRLSDLAETKNVGLINLSQPAFETPDRTTDVLGELADLPAGKYVGIIHSFNGSCHQPGPMLQRYDVKIKGNRPVVLFSNNVEDLNDREFTYFVNNIALDRDQTNSVILHTVIVYRITFDETGPLNEYFEPKGPTPVACGSIVLGLIKPHVFQVPSPQDYT